MKITVTVQFHNEVEFLKGWFESAARYADEIICANHNATDGSREFMEHVAYSGIPLTILDFPADTVHEHGFSHMKNAMIERATGDWIVCLDADETMDINRDTFADVVGNAKGISTQTMHIAYREPHWTLDNRDQIRQEAKWEVQRHWRVFKNGLGIKWRGIIHESLRMSGGLHVAMFSRNTTIPMYHYGAMANPAKRTFKDGLYAELILRAFENEELRAGTDKWWFDTYVPENREKLEKDRHDYRQARSQ